jgi:uncharacterized membrane protein
VDIYPVIFVAHIAAGVLSLLTGAIALATRKGGLAHISAGKVFVVTMLATGAGAAYLGYRAEPQDPSDIVSGVLTCYLVATAWMAARRHDGQTGAFEIIACLFAASGGVAGFLITMQTLRDGTAFLGGVPGFIFVGVAAIAATLDLSAILRRGLSGRQRIARHLWRMCLGFFIAAGAFFPGQIQIFPTWIGEIRPIILLFIPAFTIIAIMLFWLSRVLFTRWWSNGARA